MTSRVAAAAEGIAKRARGLPASAWWKFGVVAGLFVLAGIYVLVAGVPSVPQLREDVASFGVSAPILFALGFGLVTLTPFPKSVLAVVAGALWDLPMGLLITLCGVLLGASMAFFVGRGFIAQAVRVMAGPAMPVIDRAAAKSTFLAVLAVRIIPVLPFTLMNFAFGVTVVRFAPFFLATGLGSIPASGAYVAVGAFGYDVSSWQFWAALGAVGSLTLIGLILARRRMVGYVTGRAGEPTCPTS